MKDTSHGKATLCVSMPVRSLEHSGSQIESRLGWRKGEQEVAVYLGRSLENEKKQTVVVTQQRIIAQSTEAHAQRG